MFEDIILEVLKISQPLINKKSKLHSSGFFRPLQIIPFRRDWEHRQISIIVTDSLYFDRFKRLARHNTEEKPDMSKLKM